MLIVLLLVMVALGAVLITDNYVFQPACESAYEKLDVEATQHSAKSLADTRDHPYLNSADVQRIIGFAPTKRIIVDGLYLKEYYRWWGVLPLNRRYITVVYSDKEGKQFRAHQIENEVGSESLPRAEPPLSPESSESDQTVGGESSGTADGKVAPLPPDNGKEKKPGDDNSEIKSEDSVEKPTTVIKEE